MSSELARLRQLKVQIQQREQELDFMMTPKEQQRGHRFGVHTYDRPNNGTSRFGSKDRVTSESPPKRLQSGSSPLRKKSGSPSRGPILPPGIGSYNEYISQLQLDNASLQRKLTTVLQELDRVNRERSSLGQKTQLIDGEIERMKKKLKEDKLDDKGNRDLQMELNDVKNANTEMKIAINQVDKKRNQVLGQLRVLQGQRDRNIECNEVCAQDFQRKIGMVTALESELFVTRDRINKAIDEIERLQRQEVEDNTYLGNLEEVLMRLRNERDEILYKLQTLNRNYDNYMNDTNHERKQTSLHNKHQTKLMVGKCIFTLLECMLLQRKQNALNEFFNYCRFDSRCHTTLSTFVNVLDRLGKFKLRLAIQQWHQNAFKPRENMQQQDKLVNQLSSQRLLVKAYNRWRAAFLRSKNMSGVKAKALNFIWDLKAKDIGKDVMRAFTIWREATRFEITRERRLRFVVCQAYTKKLSKAFYGWQRHMQDLDNQMRLHLVAQSISHAQLKQIAFSQLKLATADRRRRRIQILRTYYKAWKESNAYRKYLMDQNVSVMHFRSSCNTSLLKMVFDALRLNKENEKHDLMIQCLEEETLPAIQDLNSTIAAKADALDRSVKTRSINLMQRMVRAWLGSYFAQWRDANRQKQFGVNVHLKQLIIRAYRQRVETAFATWKKGKQFAEITEQAFLFEEQGEQQQALMAESDELGKQIQQAKQELDRSGRNAFSRAIDIWNKRMQLNGIRTWKDRVSMMIRKETIVEDTIIKKMRLRLLRQAFDTYKEQTKRMTQMLKNETRAHELVVTRYQMRTKREIYNAFLAFTSTFHKAKTTLGILFKKVDLWRVKKIFQVWVENTHATVQDLMIEETSKQTEQLNDLMKMSKELARQHQDADQSNRQLEQRLKSNAESAMANYFVRQYNVRITVFFERWKAYIKDQKEKERIIQGLLSRQRSYAAAFLFNTLQQNAEKEKIKLYQDCSKDVSKEMAKMQEERDFQDRTYSAERQDLQISLDDEIGQANLLAERGQRSFEILVRTNMKNNFMSKLRAYFLAWHDHTKRTVAFVRTLTHVINHTLWHQGFQNINEYARDKHLTRRQNASIRRIQKMFWQRNCGSAFSRWRQTEFQVACYAIDQTQLETDKDLDVYEQQLDKFKEHNGEKYNKYVNSVEIHKVFKAWKAVTTMLKNHRNAKKVTREAFGGYLQVRALRKWIERVRVTQFARDRIAKYKKIKDRIYMQACFREFCAKFQAFKGFYLKLSNMSKKYDNTALQSAFQAIQNYTKTKVGSHDKQKKLAVGDLHSVLDKIYLTKMLHYMSELRVKCYARKESDTKRITMINHLWTRGLRRCFNKWKMQSEKCTTKEDVETCGPVVEEVLAARFQVKACLDFLKEEGYTAKQLDQFEELAEARNLDKLRKAVGHWQAYVKKVPCDNRLLPTYMNRWRFYTKMRKIINHWLDFITVKKEPLKADIKRYFDKWKYHFNSKDAFLNRENRKYLLDRAVKSQQELNNIIEEEVQNEDLINHLNQQNDELYDNYNKSTRLACCLSRDELYHARRIAFSRLKDNSHQVALAKFNEVLGANIDLIGGLKAKIAEIEKDNELLAGENEELRQFTLDGYQIAKSVTSMDQEREKLSVDLADKAAMIKKLLNENERLNAKLRAVQEHVVRTADEMQSLTRSTRITHRGGNSTSRQTRQF